MTCMTGVSSSVPIVSINSTSSSFADVLSTVVSGRTCWSFCIIALRLLLLSFSALEVILVFELFPGSFVSGVGCVSDWIGVMYH